MSIQKIGVIGGGQLAWMMADAAKSLGLELIIQTPSDRDPAAAIAFKVIIGAIADAKITAKLALHTDVITFENEFVDLLALEELALEGVCFRPSLSTLSPLLDKYEQRSYFRKLGLPVPDFITLSEGETPTSPFGFPVVVKARRHGYDGQGTVIVRDRVELEEICGRFVGRDLLLEEFVPFTKELAVIAARNARGEEIVYPVVETYQEAGVCRWAIAPASVRDDVKFQVEAIASKLLRELDAVGVFGIEFFLSREGKVSINEIAPRTHNSGHYTLDGCNISQFEMLLRAVADLPLGTPKLKSAGALMVNLLGYETATNDYQEIRDRLANMPNTFVRWYGKSESRPGRKLGHVTVLLNIDELKFAVDRAKEIENIWYS
jgi:5-(carboxyamino)imidazole ribonucleotide synthase